MGEALADVLPIAVGIVVVPLPIAATIMLLFSPQATSNGVAFLAGWVLGLTAVGAVTLLVADGGNVAEGGSPARWASALKLLLGMGLVFLAYRSFEKRPGAGAKPPKPDWMTALASFAPAKSFGLGLLLSAANPKNVLLTTGAMTGVALLGLPGVQAAVVLVVFVAVCSLGVATPILYALAGGQKARDTLISWENWLVANNAVVAAVVLLVLGVWIIGGSLAELIG